MGNLHAISTSSRGGRSLVEDSVTLRPRDLRGRWGFFASHTITSVDGTEIRLRIDVGETHGWVHIEHHRADRQWADPEYQVALISTPQPFGGLRWRFVCPERGRPCGVLHLPVGVYRFASRQAHGLAFTTQRIRAPARAALRAQRIRIALGGSAELDAPFPARPRGMWGSTYQQHRSAALSPERPRPRL